MNNNEINNTQPVNNVPPVNNQPQAPTPSATPQQQEPVNPQMNIVPNGQPPRPPMPQGQRPAPIQSIESQTGVPTQNTEGVSQPQVAASVDPIVKEEAKVEESKSEEVAPSIVEDNNNNDDTASVTFDYNEIYGTKEESSTSDGEAPATVNDKPLFTESEIVITTPSIEDRTRTDVVPEFNINALDNSNEGTEKTKLTDNVLNDKQQERADTRRKIMFIAVLVLILVIFVGFIFPILNGYK